MKKKISAAGLEARELSGAKVARKKAPGALTVKVTEMVEAASQKPDAGHSEALMNKVVALIEAVAMKPIVAPPIVSLRAHNIVRDGKGAIERMDISVERFK